MGVGFRTTRKKKNDENDDKNNENNTKGGVKKGGKDDLCQNETNGIRISGALETERGNRNDDASSKTNFGVTRTEEALHDSYVNNNNNNLLTNQTTETETEEDKTLSDNKTTKERRRKTEIIEREAQLEIKEELIEEIATLRLFKERANDDNNNIKNKNMQEQKNLEEKLSKAHEKRIEEMMSERENLLNELNLSLIHI